MKIVISATIKKIYAPIAVILKMVNCRTRRREKILKAVKKLELLILVVTHLVSYKLFKRLVSKTKIQIIKLMLVGKSEEKLMMAMKVRNLTSLVGRHLKRLEFANSRAAVLIIQFHKLN